MIQHVIPLEKAIGGTIINSVVPRDVNPLTDDLQTLFNFHRIHLFLMVRCFAHTYMQTMIFITQTTAGDDNNTICYISLWPKTK